MKAALLKLPPALAVRLPPAQRWALGFASALGLIGAIALAGWVFGLRVLDAALPHFPRMSPLTAFWLLGAASALALQIPEPVPVARRRWAQGLALALLLLGGLAGGRALLHGSLLAEIPLVPQGAPRPAPNTALAIMLAALALLGFDWRTRKGTRPAELGAAGIGLIALLALIGYAYDARHLYAIPSYSALALNTAVALLLLAGAILWARPGAGETAHLLHAGAGGHMMRRVLPAAIAIPILLGEFHVVGLDLGWNHSRIRLALLTVGNVVALAVIIFRNGRSLNGLDLARARMEAELRATNEALESRVAERTAALRAEVVERQHLEAQSRHLLEASPDAALILDGQDRLVFVNTRAEHLFGRPSTALLQTRVRALLPNYARGDASDPVVESTALKADGTEVPVSIASSRLTQGGRSLIFLNVRDISERKRIERISQATERRFRAVTDTANDAVISADEAGRILYVNPAAQRVFGYSEAQLLGLSLTELMPARYRARHQAGLRRYIESGEAALIGRSVELHGLRQGEQEFPIDLSLAAWVENGHYYFTGIIRDISARRENEERIATLNETLRRRAGELETLNHELEAFSYSVSHDLRAPLRSIDGFSQAVLEDYSEQLPEPGRDYLRRVRSAAQRMGALIDDLLKLARVTRADLCLETVDLSALAGEIGAEVGRRYPGRQVGLTVRPALVVEGDAALLRVALENLLDNAWKFTHGRDPGRVEVGPLEDGFFVLDNGAGFEPAYADRLFRPFSRLHDARAFPGTGIGLATVQRVIHKHGGSITASSRPDSGTVFYIHLSAAALSHAERAGPPGGPASASSR